MWRGDTFIPTALYIRRLHSRAIKVNAWRSLVDDRDEGKQKKKKFPLQVQQLEACYWCGCDEWRRPLRRIRRFAAVTLPFFFFSQPCV